MLTFADAKRIIKTVELNHGTESKFIDLFIEVFTMLEESTAEQLVDLENRAKDYECQCREYEFRCEKLEAELAELNKKYTEAVNSLQKSFHTMELKEALDKPKKKPGRPKKKPEDVKVETYESDLEDLNEAFGVHELAKNIFGGEE